MPHTPKVTPEQMERMLALQREGWQHGRIAEDLSLARETVCRTLRRLNRAAARRLEDRAVQERVLQLEQLDGMADEALQEWRSGKNPAVLGQARGALADKRSLLWLDAPQEVEHGGEVKIVVEYQKAPPRGAPPGAARDP